MILMILEALQHFFSYVLHVFRSDFLQQTFEYTGNVRTNRRVTNEQIFRRANTKCDHTLTLGLGHKCTYALSATNSSECSVLGLLVFDL